MPRRPLVLWPCLVAASVALGCGTDGPAPDGSARPPASGAATRQAEAEPAGGGTDRRTFLLPGVRVARGTLGDGRDVHLRVVHDDAGPCLVLAGIDGRLRGCGRVLREREPPHDRPVVAEATLRRGDDRVEVFAATSARVARVLLHVGDAAVSSRRTLLLRARDDGALDEAGIRSGAFGYFVAEVPRVTAHLRAVALDADGDEIGSASFGHLRGMGDRFVLR